MDEGCLEAETMARAGATQVMVMARVQDENIIRVVKACEDYGIEAMGDNWPVTI